DANAAGSCGVTSLGGGTCTASAVVPPPPKVAPFDPTNGPPPCTAAPCTPFYYLRYGPGLSSNVFQWNYGAPGCSNPRSFARLCHPTDALPACTACWTLVYSNGVLPFDVRIVDDATRTVLSPGAATVGATALWTVTGGAAALSAGCNVNAAPYPASGSGFGVGVDEVPGTTFHLQVQPPSGVWIIEGNMDTAGITTPDCLGHDGRRTSLIVVGNMDDSTNQLTLLPASVKGYSLLVGRDMQMTTGNTVFSTCATGAAVMVREQFSAGGNDHLEGQLIVENAASCSAVIAGSNAISTSGNFTVHVSGVPLVETGGAASTLSWAESAY
ncbi:MAG TPA: hypothetical protein VND93_12325, partial [Myxococcales bacterium]|nr:hypothetical protein [Myxococcales bacterium]